MPDWPQTGDWLVLDGAGPTAAVGILNSDGWVELQTDIDRAGVLEFIPTQLRDMLNRRTMRIADFSGFIYGEGPGSTLGLRLVAMMLRAWTNDGRQPVLSFNHLQLALLAHVSVSGAVALAPWRRDRLHACGPLAADGSLPPLSDLAPDQLPAVTVPIQLGTRPFTIAFDVPVTDFPIQRLPATLAGHPLLLRKASKPAPYTPEPSEYARWEGQRHTAP